MFPVGAHADRPVQNHRNPVLLRPQHVIRRSKPGERVGQEFSRGVDHPSMDAVDLRHRLFPYGSVCAMAREARTRRTKDDWAEAALKAIAHGGLAAVAVEPLAARLGTTKGSFYWHFADRSALVEAALQRWEQEHTEAVIELVAAEPDPRARLSKLVANVLEYSRKDQIELALLAHANDPQVGAALRRTTERRVGFVADQFRELGLGSAESQQRAVLVVSVYLGLVQLSHVSRDVVATSERAWRRQLRQFTDLLIPSS